MAYRRFRLPAETVASVANVANVAGTEPKTALRAVPSIDPCAGWDEEDWRAAFEEHAAILEYDGGHSRADAERLAREEVFGHAER